MVPKVCVTDTITAGSKIGKADSLAATGVSPQAVARAKKHLIVGMIAIRVTMITKMMYFRNAVS